MAIFKRGRVYWYHFIFSTSRRAPNRVIRRLDEPDWDARTLRKRPLSPKGTWVV